jgi:hypothetical protein
MDDQFYNTMMLLDDVHSVLTKHVPYEALADERSRLIMAQQMARIQTVLDLYGPPPGEEQPAKKRRFFDSINFKF